MSPNTTILRACFGLISAIQQAMECLQNAFAGSSQQHRTRPSQTTSDADGSNQNRFSNAFTRRQPVDQMVSHGTTAIPPNTAGQPTNAFVTSSQPRTAAYNSSAQQPRSTNVFSTPAIPNNTVRGNAFSRLGAEPLAGWGGPGSVQNNALSRNDGQNQFAFNVPVQHTAPGASAWTAGNMAAHPPNAFSKQSALSTTNILMRYDFC